MIREKIKWLDPLTQSVVLLILSLIFILLLKRFLTGFSIAAIGVIRGFYMIKNEAGLIIENEYPGEFWIKPESSDIPQKITPQTSLPIEADGIKINDKVFKIRTGTNVKITKDGKIYTYSPISQLVNEYVSEKSFNKKEYEGWKKLFEIN
jgi:hypothetical protein